MFNLQAQVYAQELKVLRHILVGGCLNDAVLHRLKPKHNTLLIWTTNHLGVISWHFEYLQQVRQLTLVEESTS